MISNDEKILLLDKRITDLTKIYLSLLDYIKKIEDGMEDPDLTLEECDLFLNDLLNKKQALLEEKQALTKSQ